MPRHRLRGRRRATAQPAAHSRRQPRGTHLPPGALAPVTVYSPEGEPKSVAIFLSGDGGWELGVINMAHALTELGAVVIGVDIRQYFANLRKAAAARGRSLPDDRRGLRVPEPPGAEATRPEQLSRAGAGRLFLRRNGGVRDPGAVPARHLCRSAQPRVLRRAGLRRRERCAREPACTTRPTHGTSSCFSRPRPSSSRGSPFRGRRIRSATPTRRMTSPPRWRTGRSCGCRSWVTASPWSATGCRSSGRPTRD